MQALRTIDDDGDGWDDEDEDADLVEDRLQCPRCGLPDDECEC